ncbi:S8 family serine peptidase [Variovorax sp. YR216]|uniref:S8 family peptidase n=1 Tax=Variovorax sp. YR216 TaxID=1882828 RepID=UPI00089D843C|nr:S8 family serine peptidase [Variovorax sp. YR216]SEB13534.1 Subtilase family protein [Variovorax sp. YR216]
MKQLLLLGAWALALGAAQPLALAAPDEQSAAVAAAAVSAPAPGQQVLLLLRLPPEHYRPENAYSGGYGDGPAHGARRRMAAALARDHGLTLVTDWAMPLLGLDCFVMQVPDDQLPENVAQALSQDPRVAWAQPMNLFRARGHDDPLYSLQPAAQAWHLLDLHEISTGRDVRVAVVDSGVDLQHPDLVGQIALKENFVDTHRDVPEDHGTAVAGIIAARADNGVGIVGVAPNARLLALRACWQESAQATLCTSLSLAMALHFAITHDAAVINLSLSGPRDRLLDGLLDVALSRNISIIGAVDRKLPDGGFPASHAGVVAVADDTGEPALRSALLAPGRDVPTTLPGGRWNLVSGSSYAAAHVAGLFALMRERAPASMAAPSVASVVSFPGGGIDACATLAHVAGDDACVRTVTRSMAPSNARQ